MSTDTAITIATLLAKPRTGKLYDAQGLLVTPAWRKTCTYVPETAKMHATVIVDDHVGDAEHLADDLEVEGDNTIVGPGGWSIVLD